MIVSRSCPTFAMNKKKDEVLTISGTTNDDFVEQEIHGTPFVYDRRLMPRIDENATHVQEMREVGKLGPEALRLIRKHFRIKNIYHSNAIEGNLLDVGETRQVVELGLTIAGKPLKDQAEAKNLGAALDFLEEIASNVEDPISMHDVRQIHKLILQDIDDANAGGFRTVDVKISGSDFEASSFMDVDSHMSEFMDWLGPASIDTENNVIEIAAACHARLAQIHPFVDGNGRTSRILMNLVLMRAGYPIAVITRDDRTRYIDALERSQVSDLTPFIGLILECVSETLEEYENAAEEQREQLEWAQSIASRMTQTEVPRAKNEYELWRSAMDLLVNHYQQIANNINDASPLVNLYVKAFGMLEFEKYLALRQRQSAKRTWFFRLDFVSGSKTARYLHFFGYANYPMSEHAQVSLHLSREESPYYFERLDNISKPNVPGLREIAYSPANEKYVARRWDRCSEQKIEHIARGFFDDVVSKHFQN